MSTPPNEPGPYELIIAPSAARRIAEQLPENVAAAIVEFIKGDLLSNPRRVGHELHDELAGVWSARRGVYRVLYEVDEENRRIRVLDADHRGRIYRRGR